MRRIKLDSFWRDYALLSEIDADAGNLSSAKENLAVASKLFEQQRSQLDSHNEASKVLARIRDNLRSTNTIDWSRALRRNTPAHLGP